MTTVASTESEHAVSPPARRALRRRQAAVLILVLAGTVVWIASWRRPSGPASGTQIHGQVANAPVGNTLRVGTFNIRGGKGIDERRDLARTAESIGDLDLIALNEVHGAWFWQSGNQAQDLGHRLGHAWLFAPTEKRWWHREFGNGLLSSVPVSNWQRIPLERQYGKSYRNVLWAVVRFNNRAIHVLVTHLDRSDDRDRSAQLSAVAELFLSLEAPALLMGDMNSTARDPIIRRLLDVANVAEGLGQVLDDHQTGRIDWIFARGLRVADAGMINTGASDHPSFWVELELPGP